MKLGYSGELTIIHNDNKFIAHNNGTRHLFQLLTSILSGNNFSIKNHKLFIVFILNFVK